jgi:hypothetical protein
VSLHPERGCHVHAAAHLHGLVFAHRELNGAAADESGRLTRLGFEPSIKLLGILGEPRLGLGVSERGQKSGRVPGGPRSELRALEQDHVAPTELR